MNHTFDRARTTALAAAVFAAGFVSEAEAQQVRRVRPPASVSAPRRAAMPYRVAPGGNPYRARNAMANPNNGQVIAALRSAMSLLAQADHDYQGHRARALGHVGTAVRHLEPAAVRRNQPNPAMAFQNAGNGAGAGKKNAMPQATSDAHLRNAMQQLNAVHTQLTNFGSTPNHARARGSVQNAIQELNIALNIR
jgi:hypothetical protein